MGRGGDTGIDNGQQSMGPAVRKRDGDGEEGGTSVVAMS